MFQRIYIEITNTCNLNCSFCVKNNRIAKLMNRNEFNHVLDEIKGYTNHVYLHVQGEPFLHPDLRLFLDDCYNKEFKVHLVTNGTLLYTVDKDFYTHPALTQLSISLHSAQMNLNDKNYIILHDLIQTIDSLNVSLFLRLWTFKDTKLVDSLIDPYQVEYSGKRIRVKKNLFIDLDEEFEWPNLNSPFQSINGTCHAGTKMMAILSNGDISPCCLDANGILKVGNIFLDTFANALKNPKYIDIIQGFKKRQCVESLCQNCTFRLRFNKKG
jgi:radical SAM protein with 4Fe4S-binding SPASM domain